MHAAITKPLFPWDALEDSPRLRTIRDLLAAVPDDELLEALRRRRANGAGDYPVRTLWGVLLLSILLRHPTMTACLEELRRNPALALIVGVEREDNVPNDWNMTRFLEVLGLPEFLPLLRGTFDAMVRRLGVAVPDLGRHTAGDSTHLKGRAAADPGTAGAEVAEGLPQPSGGRKEYTDADGKVTHTVEWFGYKLHLLVDVRHEVVLAWRVSGAGVHDSNEIEGLLGQAKANLPDGRIGTLAYDKAADDAKVHELLDEAGVKPLIRNRSMWKDGDAERGFGPGSRIPLHVVHDEAGTVFCFDDSPTPVRRAMAYLGHEKSRGTLKYRCPARHEGFECHAEARCNAGKAYGLTVRVKREIDLRRFPPIPRATRTFEALYKGRTAAERVNARFKVFWGVDDGNLRGARRFVAYTGACMVVHAGLATALAALPRREGTLGGLRLGPIAKRLAQPVRARGRGKIDSQPPRTGKVRAHT